MTLTERDIHYLRTTDLYALLTAIEHELKYRQDVNDEIELCRRQGSKTPVQDVFLRRGIMHPRDLQPD